MKSDSNAGFTLVELAVVLVIVGLVLTSLFVPISAQINQAQSLETRRDLLDIKEALLGYALINGKLPCPDTTGDGLEDACLNTNATSSTEGNLPWATLGLKANGVWGHPYKYRVNNAFTTLISLTTTGSGAGIIRVCTDYTCAKTEVSNIPLFVYSKGKNGGLSLAETTDLDEKENADQDGNYVNKAPVAGGYDDMVMWISTNILMNRMVSAGKLP
jgi:prepilin-type N-terminal cleavage/methylation domain-containing protein